MCAFSKLVNFGLEEIMGTILVAVIVAVIVGLIIYSMVRDKKMVNQYNAEAIASIVEVTAIKKISVTKL